jgi:hypothetical protein
VLEADFEGGDVWIGVVGSYEMKIIRVFLGFI